MQYELDQPLLDHRDQPITETVNGEVVTITLGVALERAAMFGGAGTDDAAKKFAQYQLAKLCSSGKTVVLNAEEVSALKALAAVVYSAVGYGAIVEALENPL